MHRSEKLKEEQLSRLKFIEGSSLMVRPGMYYNVHFVNEDTYNKLQKTFTTYTDITSIPKNAKGFILPKNNLKKDDIKEICKRYDLKITNDISNADFIIGNDHIATYKSVYDDSLDSRALLVDGHSNIINLEDCGVDLKNQFIKFMSSRAGVSADYLNEQTFVMYTSEINSRYEDWTMYANQRRKFYITDDGVFILYNMLSRKLPVVSVNSLFQGIDKVTIDKDIHDTLAMMLRGSDEDKSVAMNMLYNCNIVPSSYYIWRLLKEVNYAISYYKHRNTKAHKTFMAAVRHMEHASNIEAVALFKENGCLTEEVYNELAEKIINKVKDYHIIEEVEKHNVLSVDIKIIPYEEYILTKTEEVNV
jgi:hypothetical protein